MIAVLFALASASALAQNQVSPTPPPSKPVDSATYGPVLDPPAPPATPQQGDARPQAQEERAGQPPTSKHTEVDPSARPAPESVQPQQPQDLRQGRQERRQPAKKDPKAKQAQRRPGAVQRIESTPRINAPAPEPAARVPAYAPPAPVGPQSAQVVGCVGSNCMDAAGASYNVPTQGNTAVSSSGRLCTRGGATIQCF
jgi:hypothetical protein